MSPACRDCRLRGVPVQLLMIHQVPVLGRQTAKSLLLVAVVVGAIGREGGSEAASTCEVVVEVVIVPPMVSSQRRRRHCRGGVGTRTSIGGELNPRVLQSWMPPTSVRQPGCRRAGCGVSNPPHRCLGVAPGSSELDRASTHGPVLSATSKRVTAPRIAAKSNRDTRRRRLDVSGVSQNLEARRR